MKFSTYINGQSGGPYTLEELNSLSLERSVHVCKEGTEIWKRADEFEELKTLWKPPSPPPLPPPPGPGGEDPGPTVRPPVPPIPPNNLLIPPNNLLKKTVIGVLALIALFFLYDKFLKSIIEPVNTVTEKTNDATSITEELGSENSQKMYEELITEGVDAYGSDKLGLAFEKFSAASIIRTENRIEVSKKAQKAYKDIVSKNKENAKSDLKVLRDVALQSFLIAQQIENTEKVRKELKKLN
jgi:hypothetical protein